MIPSIGNSITKIKRGTSGKYIMGVNGSYTYISTNYGGSFTSENTGYIIERPCAINNTGRYRLVVTNSSDNYRMFMSQNYGSSYDEIITNHNKGVPPYVSMSASGQYILASVYDADIWTHNPYLSTDYGSSWSLVLDGTGFEGRFVDMSDDGKYMFISDMFTTSKASSDYGSTWVTRSRPGLSEGNYEFSMSNDGSVILGNGFDNSYNSVIYYSTDNGINFNTINSITVNGTTYGPNFQGRTSQNGKVWYILKYNSSHELFKSTDYGSSWSLVNTNIGYDYFLQENPSVVSEFGDILLLTSKISTNGGVNFTSVTPYNLTMCK